MKEKDVEQKLKKEVEGNGGLCLKWVCPGRAGVPDRIVLFPGGCLCFVELKAPGEIPRPLQVAVMDKLRNLGFRVEVIDSKEAIGKLVESFTESGDGRKEKNGV